MKNQFDKLEKIIKIHFKNKKVLENVFIHRSYLNEHKTLHLQSNEKLEFLGDSVLSLITSVYLYKKYPLLKEGDYTEIKASIVRTESLAQAGFQLKLGDFLYLSRGQEKEKGRSNKNIVADCFEALIAAIFLDIGFDASYDFVLTFLFSDVLDTIIRKKLYLSPKSKLQEITQSKFKLTPTYKVIVERGPEHQREFEVEVLIGKKRYGTGRGKSKKEAEEQAAKRAFEKLGNV